MDRNGPSASPNAESSQSRTRLMAEPETSSGLLALVARSPVMEPVSAESQGNYQEAKLEAKQDSALSTNMWDWL